MIHRDKRLLPDKRERFGKIDADPERRFEPGTSSDCNNVYLWWLTLRNKFKKCFRKTGFTRQNCCNFVACFLRYRLRIFVQEFCFFERRLENRHEILRVFALREGREDPAVLLMYLYLREERVPEHAESRACFACLESLRGVALGLDDRYRGLIAGGLNGQNSHNM